VVLGPESTERSERILSNIWFMTILPTLICHALLRVATVVVGETSPHHRHQERQKRTWSNDQLVTSLLVIQKERSSSVSRGGGELGDHLRVCVYHSIPLFLYIYIYTYTHTSPTPLKVF